MLVQMVCQSAQVRRAQTNALCPHSADPMNNLGLQVFVLKLKSFASTATVFQAGRWGKAGQDGVFSKEAKKILQKHVSRHLVNSYLFLPGYRSCRFFQYVCYLLVDQGLYFPTQAVLKPNSGVETIGRQERILRRIVVISGATCLRRSLGRHSRQGGATLLQQREENCSFWP